MSFHDRLNDLSERDVGDLERWIRHRGRVIFTALLSEYSAGLTSAMADTDMDNLEKYALTMARKSGERRGVIDAGRFLNTTLPKYFTKKNKEAEKEKK